MSDRDKPVNPFGRGERTIIRPNPGGRLPPAPAAQPPAGEGPAARPSYSPSPVPSPGAPAPSSPSSSSPIPQHPSYAAAPTSQPSEEWISTPAQAPVQQGMLPPGPPLRVDDLVAPNANPVMRAAGPLLQLLGRLRVALMRASFASLMEQVADAIKFFEKDIRSAGISEHQANTAKYILCATADDIVQHIPTDERHVWTQYSMLSRFFGERVGGVRFFEILDHLKVDPLINYPVLELQHACLALGFQGIHRTSAGGLANLQVIQRNLYELLRRVRPKTVSDLSPNWRGQALAGRR
ncbi:type IVB secretion system protein IcmH/DotU, partial [Bradyrhizobium liaoningense]